MSLTADALRQGLEGSGLHTEDGAIAPLAKLRKLRSAVAKEKEILAAWAQAWQRAAGLGRALLRAWTAAEKERDKLRAEMIAALGIEPQIVALEKAYREVDTHESRIALSPRVEELRAQVLAAILRAKHAAVPRPSLPGGDEAADLDDFVGEVILARLEEAKLRALFRAETRAGRKPSPFVAAAQQDARQRAKLRRWIEAKGARRERVWGSLTKLLLVCAGLNEDSPSPLEELQAQAAVFQVLMRLVRGAQA